MTNKNNPSTQCHKAPRMLLRAREVIFLGTCRSRQEVYRTTQELLPPLSQAYPALASLMAPVGDGIYCHHPHEAKVIATMTDVRNKGGDYCRYRKCHDPGQPHT
ncbi:hypothetical protein [Marinobacter sp. AN1]|uniref:hypothetical protein n=1 Tax=Marinobacter sp. AN1 TaxID=2886046 RepID=UPI00222F80C5|nr:hypothetical protein [Marinobacter sp. AN1]UZD64894.1 hypothetical protein LJ360_15010 [Marinobacter sp. AN1]